MSAVSEQIAQGSDPWKAVKAGKVSASRISDLLAKGKGLTRASYMADLAIERITGVFTEGYKSPSMLRGTELEPRARAAYEVQGFGKIELVGFVHHPRIPMSGASPDGRIVGTRGLVQLKCPEAKAHFEYLDGGEIPKAYRDQVQWEMSTDNRDWCDFASFHPDFPSGMDLYVRRVERDNGYIAEIEGEVRRFLVELDAKVAALRARYGQEMEAA